MNTKSKKRPDKVASTAKAESATIDFNPAKKRSKSQNASKPDIEKHVPEFSVDPEIFDETARKAKRGRRQKPKPLEYEVFHSMGDFFYVALGTARASRDSDLVEAFLEGKYASVFASKISEDFPVEIEYQLERIFFETQNLDEAWNPPNRSTSVGDIVRLGDDFWVVASVGWRKLEMPDDVLRYLRCKLAKTL